MSKQIIAAHVMPSEATPLLTPGLERNNPFEHRTKRKSWQTAPVVINIMYLTVLLFSFGDKLSEGPLLRVKEAVICYRHYERVDPSKLLLGRDQIGPGAIGGVLETLCKVDDVQNDLAALNGWQMVFDGIPGLLLAIPLGWAADKFGRWPVVEIGIISLAAKIAWMEIVTWYVLLLPRSTLLCICEAHLVIGSGSHSTFACRGYPQRLCTLVVETSSWLPYSSSHSQILRPRLKGRMSSFEWPHSTSPPHFSCLH